MLDALLKIVDSDTVNMDADVDAAGEIHPAVHNLVGSNTTAAGGGTGLFRIGTAQGIPLGAQMLVVREDVLASIVDPLTITLHLSTSNEQGSDSRPYDFTLASVVLPAAAGPGRWTAPIGLMDHIPEQIATADNVNLIVDYTINDGTGSASTVDPTFSVYLTAGERVTSSDS